MKCIETSFPSGQCRLGDKGGCCWESNLSENSVERFSFSDFCVWEGKDSSKFFFRLWSDGLKTL